MHPFSAQDVSLSLGTESSSEDDLDRLFAKLQRFELPADFVRQLLARLPKQLTSQPQPEPSSESAPNPVDRPEPAAE